MFMHGFTYSGHPVACAVGLRNIQIIEEENLPANARETGDHLRAELNRLLADHKNVGDIRGKGQMTIVELVANRETKEKLDPATNPSATITASTRNHGVIVRPTNDGVGIAPPLIITKEQATTLAEGVAAGIQDVLR
jgi:4-aminobutyrate--pyruvate transaminase